MRRPAQAVAALVALLLAGGAVGTASTAGNALQPTTATYRSVGLVAPTASGIRLKDVSYGVSGGAITGVTARFPGRLRTSLDVPRPVSVRYGGDSEVPCLPVEIHPLSLLTYESTATCPLPPGRYENASRPRALTVIVR
jgi:hypothetical protein